MNRDDEAYVYVMAFREGDQIVGPVKVGIAQDPEARRRELQTGHHREIVIAAQILAPTRWMAKEWEAGFHELKVAKRLRGEWFDVWPPEAIQFLYLLVRVYLRAAGVPADEEEAALEVMGLEKARLASIQIAAETLQ